MSNKLSTALDKAYTALLASSELKTPLTLLLHELFESIDVFPSLLLQLSSIGDESEISFYGLLGESLNEACSRFDMYMQHLNLYIKNDIKNFNIKIYI